MALADDLLTVLDDPQYMWAHALKELSGDAQRLFLTLTLLPKPVSTDVLQVAYTSQAATRAEPFLDSLRALEDSFVSIKKPYSRVRSVSFRNPSLQDFANKYVDENSDFLEILLSTPVFYEQIIGAFSLAMAQSAVRIDVHTGKRVDTPAKYAGIKQWVLRQSDRLIKEAMDLLNAERAEIYGSLGRSRFSQLLEVMATYGMPIGAETHEELRSQALSVVNPLDGRSADISMQLISNPVYKPLIDRILNVDSAAAMREHLINRGTWTFGFLLRLDEMLGLNQLDSMVEWGFEYEEYARQLTAELANSVDYGDIQDAIDELTHLNDKMILIHLDDEIEKLENQREALIGRSRDYDEPDNDTLYSISDSPRADSSPDSADVRSDYETSVKHDYDTSAQLDQIFDSLL